MLQRIAVLITCHNRKDKTILCLASLFKCVIPNGYAFETYLVDDASTDGTVNAVKEIFPKVKIFFGSGNLYWAGGMRLAWSEAILKKYDAYLLLNDDVELIENVFQYIYDTHKFALNHFGKGGIYVSTTINKSTGSISYGGHVISRKFFRNESKLVIPKSIPISCQIANANILFVCSNVVETIGIFDTKFTHSIADFDYSHTAYKKKIPLLVCPGIGGYCEDDHGNNWVTKNSTINERIDYLYSPKGLAYKEYLFYIRKHFPFTLPYLFVMLWAKTFFPGIWDILKKRP